MNTKTQISRTPAGIWQLKYWKPTPVGILPTIINFRYSEGAFNALRELEFRIIRDKKAFSLLAQIRLELCSLEEEALIKKLQKSACVKITKRQYGYLKGSIERQGL